MKLTSIFSALIFFLVLGCNKTSFPETTTPKEEVSVEDLAQADVGFGIDLFKVLVETVSIDTNIIISPLSIESAFFMAANGAEGETRQQILETLHLGDLDMASLNASYLELRNLLDYQGDTTRLEMANAVFWDDQRIALNDDFLQKLTQSYQSEQQVLDFSGDAALETINGWVDEKTEGRIKEILKAIPNYDVLYLINALYFIGDWENPFDTLSTGQGVFVKPDGSEKVIDFMYKDAGVLHYQDEVFQAVELPFANPDFSMSFLMPKEQSIQDFVRDLTPDRLSQLYDTDIATGRILLRLPKFQLEYGLSLINSLKSMGMELPFSEIGADFSNLGDPLIGSNLHITSALHKTFLKIDEKGAEGAAVTSIGVGVTSVPPQFIFDRPFVTILRNTKTGHIIFIGKIVNP